jgi:hypothetical protein
MQAGSVSGTPVSMETASNQQARRQNGQAAQQTQLEAVGQQGSLRAASQTGDKQMK